MIFGALAITSFGNMIESSAPVRTPSAMASSRIERLRPSRPPRPSSVKPKPSWMPVPNSTEMMISSEKPGVPSGILVLTMQIALIVTNLEQRELERARVLAAGGVDRTGSRRP